MFKIFFAPTPGWIKSVEKNGEPAHAVILTDPSHILGGVPEYKGRDAWIDVEAEVYPSLGEAYPVKMKARLSQSLGGMLGPGLKVNVRIDPKDRSHVVLMDDVNTLLRYHLKQ